MTLLWGLTVNMQTCAPRNKDLKTFKHIFFLYANLNLFGFEKLD